MADQFRRTDPRYERHVAIELEVSGQRHTATTRNLSLGGMYVETEQTFPVGTTVQVRFKLPTQVELIEVAGDVRWVDPTGPSGVGGMGVRFQGLRARDVWALNRFFQT